jgi:hypothetical protein
VLCENWDFERFSLVEAGMVPEVGGAVLLLLEEVFDDEGAVLLLLVEVFDDEGGILLPLLEALAGCRGANCVRATVLTFSD